MPKMSLDEVFDDMDQWDKPKPCPFCQTTEVNSLDLLHGLTPVTFFASCNYCYARGPDAKTEEQAFALWNIREISPEKFDQLRKTLKDVS